MRLRLFLLTFFILSAARVSFSQIVGTDCFLQGHWIEVGIDKMGAFGTCTSPVGYHPHVCCGTAVPFTSGGNLDVCYDWGHDGWSVGMPAEMGDYTIPGYPQEGWSVQVGATEYRNWAGGGICTGPFMVTGSNTLYSNTGGIAKGMWDGSVAGLHILQETSVDTNASWVIVTTRIYNTTAAPIAGVWYERTCDPDNTSFWSGTPTTRNIIVHQNEDSRHLVQVVAHGQTAASGTTPAYNQFNSYMALATKDCRARCGVVPALTPGTTPAALWAGTGTTLYVLGDSNYQDQGIYLAYNLGTLSAAGTPGDSVILSYAYIYMYPNNHTGIDSAFPDPQLVINNSLVTAFPDTFDMCTLPSGVDTFPIDIIYASDKDWSWSTWTWSPGTGLSATTGVHSMVHGSGLTGPTTFTVTGTDSATGMTSCHNRTFVFTIRPCHFAFANYPCVGDSLRLDMSGDTVGASYYWWGPAAFTSTLHRPFRYPTFWYDTGTYYVVKSVGSFHDTDYVHVNFHSLPTMTATSNIPHQCDPFVTPLNLTVTTDSAVTFWWTGPKGYATNIQNPVINPFDSSQSGMYVVTGTTVYGCHSTDSTFVWPRPMPQIYTKISYGCVVDTVQFFNYTYNANTYHWIFGDPSPDEFVRAPIHYYRANNQAFFVHINQGNALCLIPDSVFVDLRHSIHASFHPMPDSVCFDAGVPIYFADSSYANDSTFQKASGTAYYPTGWLWNFGDGSPTETIDSPHHVFGKPGVYPVKLTAYDAMGCPNDTTNPAFVLKIKISSFHDTLLCISQPLALENDLEVIPRTGGANASWKFKYAWSQSAPNLDDTTVKVPHLTGVGNFTDILTVTVPGVFPNGCPAVDTMHINSVLGKKLQNLTVSATIAFGSSIQLNAGNEVVYYWLPNDGSLNNPNISNPIATPQKTTIYTVYGLDGNGCRDSADIIIYLDTTMTQDIPSGFTPNGDGINDVFKPVGIKFQNLVEFRVFNRWGQELFYTNNKEVGWDGTYHGEKQDLGVYNYLIVVSRPGQTNIVYKGNVTLLR
jgi:gliding motility-associated-like protein